MTDKLQGSDKTESSLEFGNPMTNENNPASSKHSTNDDESWDGCSNDEAPKLNRGRTVSFGGIPIPDETPSTKGPEDIPTTVVNPGLLLGMIFGCAKWSEERLRSTALGLVSSITVLVVRLLLDSEPTAYLIHSIVVFLDMALIHAFTNSIWLSVSGELVTIAMAFAFHMTKQTVWELLETTILAILCSFHLINSRNKYMDNAKELRHDLNTICHETSGLLSASVRLDDEDEGSVVENEDRRAALIRRQSSRRLQQIRSTMVNWDSDRSIEFDPADNDHVGDLEKPVYSKHGEKVKVWGEKFFEHFLDGSAGVMYTSFFGLILDEMIRLNDDINCK